LSAVGLALTLTIGLAGCNAGGGSAGAETEPSIGASVEAFLQEAGPATGASSINVLAQDSPQSTAIEAISGQFTDLTGIDVNWTKLDEHGQANKAAIALGSSGGGYDVVQLPSNLISTYASREWIRSVDSMQSDDAFQVPGWSPETFGKGVTDLLSQEGELYAAPMFTGTQIFYYRTDLFEAAGITEPPTTYEELVEDAKKLDDGTVSGIAMRSAPDISQLLFDWSAWLYAYGGGYYETYEDGVYSGSALDSQAAVDALEDYSTLLQDFAPSGATNWSVTDVTRAFASGQVAMIQEGAVFGGTFNDPEKSQVAGKVGTFTLPEGPAGSFVPYNAHGWAVATNSQAADAGWLFSQWATLTETLTTATDNPSVAFSTPPIADVYTSPAYEERYGFADYVTTVTETLEIANSGGVTPLEGDAFYQPSQSEWSSVGQDIAQELSKAVTGQVSAEEAIEKAAEYLK
jgi:ABC-type glycerol-3-phosphate transport system substrate-binding protein